ncbi:MAG: RT0821/Lpp0805 family surface protein [Notoacmeibacter sp.]
MRTTYQFIALAVAAATLSGCLSSGLAPQTATPVAPTSPVVLTASQLLEPLKGGLIGTMSEGLTPAEKQKGLVAEYQALETSFGQAPIIWTEEKSGNTGEVVAGAPYRVGQQDCRSFSHKLTRKLAVSSKTGSACRQRNGSWLLLE